MGGQNMVAEVLRVMQATAERGVARFKFRFYSAHDGSLLALMARVGLRDMRMCPARAVALPCAECVCVQRYPSLLDVSSLSSTS